MNQTYTMSDVSGEGSSVKTKQALRNVIKERLKSSEEGEEMAGHSQHHHEGGSVVDENMLEEDMMWGNQEEKVVLDLSLNVSMHTNAVSGLPKSIPSWPITILPEQLDSASPYTFLLNKKLIQPDKF